MDNLFKIADQFRMFQQKIKQTGRDPKQLLNELIQNGRVTREQVDRATQMANTLKTLLRGKL